MPDEENAEAIMHKIRFLRHWLRYHGDYAVDIDLWGMYGTYVVHLRKLGKTLETFIGDHLEKRLDEVIACIEQMEE